MFDSVVETVRLLYFIFFFVDHKLSLKNYIAGRPICRFTQLTGAYRMLLLKQLGKLAAQPSPVTAGM